MKITIALKGTLQKYFEGDKERIVEVPENCTCDEALQVVGLNYKETQNFGFVSVNGKRVMIYDKLQEGDLLKAFSKVSGG